MRLARPLRAWAMLSAAVLLSACRSGPPGPYAKGPVVLVSIDTLRADRLALYGYAKGATPHLDALGREAVVFEDAYSHCPLTLPAHASLFTGLLPPHHGVRDNEGFALGPDRRTLATRFRAAGWPTGAAVSAFVLRSATGLAAGFESYDDALTVEASAEGLGSQQRDGALAVQSLLEWIGAHSSGRFFAFLHLYEPHAPYAPPAAYRHLPDPYDGEVAYADELVGRLVARLRELGLWDRTILAVTSDHGEGLRDHGEQEHGFFLYREALRVPLILRLPGGARGGARVRGLAAQVDLAPTLLDLSGLAADGMDGRSLRPAVAAGRIEPRPVYAETFFPRYHFGWSELRAVTDERYRYIQAPRPELYDVKADPAERANLAGERAQTVASMAGWLQTAVGTVDAPPQGKVPADVAERLQALGYVGAAAAHGATSSGPRVDPKDRISAYEAFRQASLLHARGDEAAAAAELRRVLAEDPSMPDAWYLLGLALFRGGQTAEAVSALEEVLRLAPASGPAHLALARIHAASGRWDLVRHHAEGAAAAEPGEAYETLAGVLLEQDRPAEAAEYARRSLAADRARARSAFVLGEVARRQGRFAEAIPAYRQAVEALKLRKGAVLPGLHAALADCLARLGQSAEAEAEFQAEIQAIPYSRSGRTGLAMLYRSQGRDAEARGVLEGVVSAHPRPGAEEYWTVVRVLAGLGDAAGAREWAARARGLFPDDRRFRGGG
jgi:choline-sulfatase